MRVFTRVVERRSFTLAAEDLGLPRSTVTDAVKQLEARLGVRLLERTTRQVRPTLDGEAHHRRCLSLIADLEDAEGAFGGAKPKGLVRAGCARHAGASFRDAAPAGLPRRISRYRTLHERGRSAGRPDPRGHRLRAARRRSPGQRHDRAPRRDAREITCAGPAYIDRFGQPASVDALDGHLMVGFHSSATGTLAAARVRGRRRRARGDVACDGFGQRRRELSSPRRASVWV